MTRHDHRTTTVSGAAAYERARTAGYHDGPAEDPWDHDFRDRCTECGTVLTCHDLMWPGNRETDLCSDCFRDSHPYEMDHGTGSHPEGAER